MNAENMRFGVAGWSYPDWNGVLYPPGTRDGLRYLAPYIDLMEINSTFYRPPAARAAATWVERGGVNPRLTFSAKLHRDATHGGRLDLVEARRFMEGLAPVVAAGKLSHLLAQFPYDFEDAPEHRDHLSRIREAFGHHAVLVVELRHNTWQAPKALGFLEGLGVTVANLDYPLARNSFNLRECRVGRDRYLRLHGRNARAWFDKQAGRDETYNYYYSGAELAEIGKRARALATDARSLTVVGNNHFQAREVTNILQLKALLTGTKVAVPGRLLQSYPELKDVAREL